MGGARGQQLINIELHDLLVALRATHNQPVDPHPRLMRPIGNVLFQMIFSTRLSDHPNGERLARELRDAYSAINYKFLPLHSLLERFTPLVL